MEKNWYGEINSFQGFQEKKLLVDEYFNFLILPTNLRILHTGPLLRKLRMFNNLSLAEASEKVSIAKSVLWKYEQQRLNPTLFDFKRFIECYSNDKTLEHLDFMKLLEQHSLNSFTFKIKCAKFPFKASKEVESLMRVIQPRRLRMITILTSDEQQIQDLNQTFGLDLELKNNSKLFFNTALHSFLETFGLYKVTK